MTHHHPRASIAVYHTEKLDLAENLQSFASEQSTKVEADVRGRHPSGRGSSAACSPHLGRCASPESWSSSPLPPSSTARTDQDTCSTSSTCRVRASTRTCLDRRLRNLFSRCTCSTRWDLWMGDEEREFHRFSNWLLHDVRCGMRSEAWRYPRGGEYRDRRSLNTSYLTSGTDRWTLSFRPIGQGARTSVSGGTDETLLVGPTCTSSKHHTLGTIPSPHDRPGSDRVGYRGLNRDGVAKSPRMGFAVGTLTGYAMVGAQRRPRGVVFDMCASVECRAARNLTAAGRRKKDSRTNVLATRARPYFKCFYAVEDQFEPFRLDDKNWCVE